MADNVAVTAGSGTNIAADELTDATLGSVKVQFIKLMDGTLDGSLGKAAVKQGGTLPNASTDGALVVTIRDINANGATTSSASAPVVPATDWVGTTALGKFGTGYYVACPASATTTLQSTTGAIGDYLSGVLIVPAVTAGTAPGAVSVVDNATSILVFAGGTASASNLVPFFVPLGAVSRSGAWKVTTGANVTAIGIGKFS